MGLPLAALLVLPPLQAMVKLLTRPYCSLKRSAYSSRVNMGFSWVLQASGAFQVRFDNGMEKSNIACKQTAVCLQTPD
jgi:hypothetical protein